MLLLFPFGMVPVLFFPNATGALCRTSFDVCRSCHEPPLILFQQRCLTHSPLFLWLSSICHLLGKNGSFCGKRYSPILSYPATSECHWRKDFHKPMFYGRYPDLVCTVCRTYPICLKIHMSLVCDVACVSLGNLWQSCQIFQIFSTGIAPP